jgi:hypothetical protein
LTERIRKYNARRAGDGVTAAAYTEQLAARITTCTNDLAGTAQASTPMTNIPVVLVNTQVNGSTSVYPTGSASSLINGMNNAFRRAGFSFSLARQLTAQFASVNDVICNAEDPTTCARCAWYRTGLPRALRNSGVLVLYIIERTTAFGNEGEAPLPTVIYEGPKPLACIDGVTINAYAGASELLANTNTSVVDAVASDVATTVHEVRAAQADESNAYKYSVAGSRAEHL